MPCENIHRSIVVPFPLCHFFSVRLISLRYMVCNLPIDGYQSRIEVFFSFRNLFFKFFNPFRSIFNEFCTVQPNFSWNPHHFFPFFFFFFLLLTLCSDKLRSVLYCTQGSWDSFDRCFWHFLLFIDSSNIFLRIVMERVCGFHAGAFVTTDDFHNILFKIYYYLLLCVHCVPVVPTFICVYIGCSVAGPRVMQNNTK